MTYVEFPAKQANKWITGRKCLHGVKPLKRHIDAFDCHLFIFAEDKHRYPTVTSWADYVPRKPTPYPNFDKDFSLVWTTNITLYGSQWIDAAHRFYNQCKVFFDGDHSSYAGAYPKPTEKETAQCVADFKKVLDAYPTKEHASVAFGVVYTGNVADFLKRKWKAELEEIRAFLMITSYMLDTKYDV